MISLRQYSTANESAASDTEPEQEPGETTTGPRCLQCPSRQFGDVSALESHCKAKGHVAYFDGKEHRFQNDSDKRQDRKRDSFDEFFESYPSFDYDRTKSYWDEFYRFLRFMGWDDKKVDTENPQRKNAWKRFRVAVVRAFGEDFGSNEKDPEAWRRLCLAVGIVPVPEKLSDRQKVSC